MKKETKSIKYYTAYVSKMSKNISFVENMNFKTDSKVVYTV